MCVISAPSAPDRNLKFNTFTTQKQLHPAPDAFYVHIPYLAASDTGLAGPVQEMHFREKRDNLRG